MKLLIGSLVHFSVKEEVWSSAEHRRVVEV